MSAVAECDLEPNEVPAPSCSPRPPLVSFLGVFAAQHSFALHGWVCS